MGSTLFRDPRAFGALNRVDPLDSVSNYYVENQLAPELEHDTDKIQK